MGGTSVFRSAIAAALLGCAQWAGAAEASGIATIVEGKAVVIRALSKLDAAVGVRLLADDLVHTGKDTFMRIEYDDGASVPVGPETLLQLNSPSRRKSERPGLYLLSGWLKLISGKAGTRCSFGSPQFDVLELSGAVATRVEAGSGAVFVEQGTARWVDRRAHGAPPISLKSGDYLSIRQDDAPSLDGRPTQDFLSSVPRPFRDTLPAGHPPAVAAKSLGPFSYSEVESWVNAEPPIRRQFVRLWRVKADDEAFRASLERSLSLHPEWAPVLYPELYEPKPPQQATPSAATPVAGPLPEPQTGAAPRYEPRPPQQAAPSAVTPVAGPVTGPVPEPQIGAGPH
jgi:hypothetical protein